MTSIEILAKNAQSISAELESLKQLQASERTPKQTELKSQIDQVQGELQSHLQTLDSKSDAQSGNEREKTEQLLSSMQIANDKLLQLGAEVQGAPDQAPTGEEKKGFKQRWSDLWSDGKRKETAGKVGMAAGAVAGVNRLWNKVSGWFGGGKSDSSKKTSRWQKGLKFLGITGGSILAYSGLSKLRDKLKEWMPDLLGPEESFEAALNNTQAQLQQVDEQHLKLGIDMKREIQEGATIGKLTSYGETTEIDLKNKKIPGMSLDFTKYRHLIHAANMANFCKSSFRGRCVDNNPFSDTSLGGDLQVKLAEEGNEEFVSGRGVPMGKILGLALPTGFFTLTPRGKGASKVLGIKGSLATIVGMTALGHYTLDRNDTLSNICPQIADGGGRANFLGYLNGLGIWEKGNIDKKGNNKEIEAVTPSRLSEDIIAIIKEIQATNPTDEQGGARMLDAKQDPTNPEKFTISSYSKETVIFYDEQHKTIRIDGLEHTFTNPSEGLLVANLTNKLIKKNKGLCNSDQPFSYRGHVKGVLHPGIYIDNDRLDDRDLSEKAFKKAYPALFKHKKIYIEFLNAMKGWKK